MDDVRRDVGGEGDVVGIIGRKRRQSLSRREEESIRTYLRGRGSAPDKAHLLSDRRKLRRLSCRSAASPVHAVAAFPSLQCANHLAGHSRFTSLNRIAFNARLFGPRHAWTRSNRRKQENQLASSLSTQNGAHASCFTSIGPSSNAPLSTHPVRLRHHSILYARLAILRKTSWVIISTAHA